MAVADKKIAYTAAEVAESFFTTLKKELIFRKKYATIEEVKTDLYRYIELFYNRKRLHSTLGYMSPVSYRLENTKLAGSN